MHDVILFTVFFWRSSLTQVAAMEVDPTESAEKLTELLAILALALISVVLGLTIGFVIYLAWKGNYLRELRMLVRAAVDLIMSVVHSVQDGTQRAARPASPPMDAHEDGARGRSDDDTERVVRSAYHCCSHAEAPTHEGCDSDDTAELHTGIGIHEESSSDDDNAVIVSGPAGRYIVSQLRGPRVPREQRPEGTVHPQ